MGNNKLKLNPDKMEFIVSGDDQIISSLGLIMDAENSIQRHVANLCRISYYHLWEGFMK